MIWVFLLGSCQPESRPLPSSEESFWWGVATSPYQTEDVGEADFATDWDLYADRGRIAAGRGEGARSWSRFERDLEALQALEVTHYRFGVEWARVEPRPGEFDDRAIEEYARRAAALREADIVPVVCLWHFTFPDWATDLDRGDANGWLHPEAQVRWAPYIARMTQAMAQHVDLYAPQNEPNAAIMAGYFIGMWPPGIERDLGLVSRHTDAAADRWIEAADVIREHDPSARILTIQNIIAFAPEPWDVAGLFTSIAEGYNYDHLDRVAVHADMVGFNYYHRRAASPFPVAEQHFPRGIRVAIEDLSDRYERPVVIMENGIGTDDDALRSVYLRAHIRQVALAREDGFDVRGYFAWSLMDNFEWALGFESRYGLYSVEPDTFALTPKDSAEVYRRLIDAERTP
jgi:beta-glucosidase